MLRDVGADSKKPRPGTREAVDSLRDEDSGQRLSVSKFSPADGISADLSGHIEMFALQARNIWNLAQRRDLRSKGNMPALLPVRTGLQKAKVVGEWRFSQIHCDIFVTLDVMMCTASILNLCAISIDRYTAVAMPMLYNTRYSSKRRVTVMITVVWVLSFAISCPLLFGLNNTVPVSFFYVPGPDVAKAESAIPWETVRTEQTLLVSMENLTGQLEKGFQKPIIFSSELPQTYKGSSQLQWRQNGPYMEKNECIIANPAFVVYSSIVSFYVPFIVTLLVYVQIYIVLRKRRKRVNTKRIATHMGPDSDTQAPLKDKCTHPEDVRLCTLIVKSNGSFPVNKRKVEAVNHIEEMEMATSTSPPEKSKHSKPPVARNNEKVQPATSKQCVPSGLQSPMDSPSRVEKNGHTTNHPKAAKVFEIQTMPNGKTRTSLKSMSRRKFSQQKEKKATQMLAIVLGVFIICWLPFFITHILNMHCDCNIPQAMYNAFTWLGYVNSAVNPIIYTTFNIEFRKAFIKILHC
ncbi:UNVERIFIED_CONTAM: D(2) dopamine receptor A [Gekko kuhli]